MTNSDSAPSNTEGQKCIKGPNCHRADCLQLKGCIDSNPVSPTEPANSEQEKQLKEAFQAGYCSACNNLSSNPECPRGLTFEQWRSQPPAEPAPSKPEPLDKIRKAIIDFLLGNPDVPYIANSSGSWTSHQLAKEIESDSDFGNEAIIGMIELTADRILRGKDKLPNATTETKPDLEELVSEELQRFTGGNESHASIFVKRIMTIFSPLQKEKDHWENTAAAQIQETRDLYKEYCEQIDLNESLQKELEFEKGVANAQVEISKEKDLEIERLKEERRPIATILYQDAVNALITKDAELKEMREALKEMRILLNPEKDNDLTDYGVMLQFRRAAETVTLKIDSLLSPKQETPLSKQEAKPRKRRYGDDFHDTL